MEKISTIKANILQFIDYKGITKSLFFERTGIPYSNFKGKSLESEIGGNMIAKILTTFPELSAEWLLTGKGSMIKNIDPSNSIVQNQNIGPTTATITSNSHLDVTGPCKLCEEKEKRICELKEQIETLKDQLKVLQSVINR